MVVFPSVTVESSPIPFDLTRMLFGDAPPLILLEIALRTVVIYAYTLLLLRWVGGRSVSQLSLIGFLLVIALGSAVGDALFYPDVPLLHAMLVITPVIVADKGLDALILRFRWAKIAVDGAAKVVVRDGIILQDGIGPRTIGAAELRARLRVEGIVNLGEVASEPRWVCRRLET